MKEKNPVSLDVTHTTLAVLFIGMIIASCFWILYPFLISIVWASLIVIATWPALIKLQGLLAGKRGLAVTVMTLAILLIVLIPLTLAVLTIVNNADNITSRVSSLTSSKLPLPPDWFERIPIAGKRVAQRWRELAELSPDERSSIVNPYLRSAMQWIVVQVGSIGMAMLQFFLTAIIAAIIYAKGELVSSGILSFARRLAGPQGEEVTVLAGKAIRGVALGVVLTAIIQTTIGGIGMLVTGVPAAALLTVIVFMLCLIQLGPVLVMVPAVIWLYWTDGALWGTILLIFTILAAIIDNFIRPFLIKKGADLPLVLIFAGVIGGLIAFGVMGLFIGPVVLAVAYTLLKVWVSGSAQEDEVVSSID